jgi:L-lactate dehydrogenase complex protein LldG
MNNASRNKILGRLNAAIKPGIQDTPQSQHPHTEMLAVDQKVEKLKELMQAVRTEVHVTTASGWVDQLKHILKQRKLKTLLYAPETTIGDRLKTEWPTEEADLPQLTTYEGDIEDFKEKLFQIDAAITSTVGGIAETGVIILWPDKKEPRLMSLVPTIHIAVLEADKIYNTFSEAIETENWPDKMPTNVLLISGPSKTADIELTLAFGVHGPKELILLIIND